MQTQEFIDYMHSLSADTKELLENPREVEAVPLKTPEDNLFDIITETNKIEAEFENSVVPEPPYDDDYYKKIDEEDQQVLDELTKFKEESSESGGISVENISFGKIIPFSDATKTNEEVEFLDLEEEVDPTVLALGEDIKDALTLAYNNKDYSVATIFSPDDNVLSLSVMNKKNGELIDRNNIKDLKNTNNTFKPSFVESIANIFINQVVKMEKVTISYTVNDGNYDKFSIFSGASTKLSQLCKRFNFSTLGGDVYNLEVAHNPSNTTLLTDAKFASLFSNLVKPEQLKTGRSIS